MGENVIYRRVPRPDPGLVARAAACAMSDLYEALDPGVRRLVHPHVYHVSITDELFATKQELVARLG